MVPLPLAEEALEGLTSPSLDIKDWLNKFAPSAVLKMKEEEEGGGGFSNRGKKEGILSATTGDRKWVFKCRCSHAFGCPAAVSVTVRRLTNTLVVEGAAGWLHKHDGDRSTSEGLPPSIKALIQKTIEEHPGIKCKALKCLLWETYNVDKALYDEKVDTYFYKGCRELRAGQDLTIGVSSFGTAVTFAENNELFARVAAHTEEMNKSHLDVGGVIGYYADPSTRRCFVMLSTLRLLIDTCVQS
jgi:hypothetical protein